MLRAILLVNGMIVDIPPIECVVVEEQGIKEDVFDFSFDEYFDEAFVLWN